MEDVREFTNEAALLAEQKACFRVLSDLHEALLRFSMLDVYNIPGMVKEIVLAANLPVHKFRRAVILPDQWKLSGFFETISKNRMQNVTLFHDIETAQKWLLEK